LVTLGLEEFVEGGQIDGPEDELVVFFDADGDAEEGQASDEAGGAVDGVDKPAVL